MRTLVVALAVSFFAAVALVPWLRDLALRRQLLDPASGGRRLHLTPIPRVGGIALVIAFLIPIAGMLVYRNDLTDALWADRSLLLGLGVGGSFIVGIGVIDDLVGVRARFKLVAQCLAGLAVCWAGVDIDVVRIPLWGVVELGWWSVPATVLWVAVVTNALNLIDGMDGLAGGVTAIASGTLFVMSIAEGDLLAAMVLSSLVGSTLGFLLYNVRPATVFLGDTGSLFQGFVLALVSVHSAQKGYALFSLVGAFLALGLPIFDLIMAVVRRALMGRPLFAADQHHLHHQLLKRGLTQAQTVGVLLGAALVLEAVALISIFADDWLSALAIAAVVPAVGIAVRFLGYGRTIRAGRIERLLRDLETVAELRRDRLQVLHETADSGASVEDVWAALVGLCERGGVERVELRLPEGTRLWERSRRAAERGVHLEGLVRRDYSLALGGVAFGAMTVEWYGARGCFAPFDELLAQGAAHATQRALAQRRLTLSLRPAPVGLKDERC